MNVCAGLPRRSRRAANAGLPRRSCRAANAGLPRRSRRAAEAGFTLLELVVVIAIIGILAAALAPSVIQQVLDTRIEGTREELEAIHAGMVGEPGRNEFGFVGHIGRLPSSLQELVAPGGLPGYTTNTVREIGMGWRGPYVNIGSSAGDILTDAFGRAYTLSDGRVRSAGPDGIANNADDLVYPPATPIWTGDVSVTLRLVQGNRVFVDPKGYRVDLYYPNAGSQSALSDENPPFVFSNVPVGPRAIQVIKMVNPDPGTIVAEDTVVVRPSSTTAVDAWF